MPCTESDAAQTTRGEGPAKQPARQPRLTALWAASRPDSSANIAFAESAGMVVSETRAGERDLWFGRRCLVEDIASFLVLTCNRRSRI